ncbi:hypothetical protein C451_04903 [Halococcus thailandensis JCM 13552]|uniref:Uncharacterized protein n=1 Tax=Halococcus thailandensis JCM 13552 TaxID=1227457 RepID=M0NGH3_9EURY|nr:hypothetical protein C451_04903 [Halococcus thailandensis JCM 13552]
MVFDRPDWFSSFEVYSVDRYRSEESSPIVIIAESDDIRPINVLKFIGFLREFVCNGVAGFTEIKLPSCG